MGRDKQRTKGGIKPSSSGRTAELLARTEFGNSQGSQAGGFSSAFSPVLSFSSAGTFDALLDSDTAGLSSEVQIIIGKLGKKDATTKIKALQELTDLCKGEEEEKKELCSDLLRFFPRIYSKIAKDDSRKIRENSHALLEVIAKQVGKKLAPFLKSIAPIWFLSQSDIFPPAASAARISFKSVFQTDIKQIEALTFCIEEIMTMIRDNLEKPLLLEASSKKKEGGGKKDKGFTTDIRLLPDPNETEPYSLRMLYATILSSKRLSELNLGKSEFFNELLQNDNFWNLTKHTNPLIRRVTFDLIATLSNSNSKNQIQIDGVKCTKMVDQALKSETSPEVLRSLWNCFLLLNLNNCGIESSGSAHKQILLCVQKGFYGNSSSLGPFLLPLFSKLPSKISESPEFRKDVFEAFETGFNSEKSLMEKAAILKTFAEVIAFLLKKEDDIAQQLERMDTEEVEEEGIKRLKSEKNDDLNQQIFVFISKRLADSSIKVMSEFASTFGNLVKSERFYDEFLQSPDLVFDEKFGRFIVDLCFGGNAQKDIGERRKSVKFRQDTIPYSEETRKGGRSSFGFLSELKQRLVQNVVRICLEKKAIGTLSVLIRSFSSSDSFFNDMLSVGVEEENLLMMLGQECGSCKGSEVNKFALNINLDLLKIFPDRPRILASFSTIFEAHFSDSWVNFNEFISHVNQEEFYLVNPIKSWLRMPLFSDKMSQLLKNAEKSSDILPMVKFLLERGGQVFSQEELDQFFSIIEEKKEHDFSEGISQIIMQVIRSQAWQANANDPIQIQTDFTRLLITFWTRFVQESIHLGSGDSKVIGENCKDLATLVLDRGILGREVILSRVISKFINFESCDTTQKLDSLLEIAKPLLSSDNSENEPMDESSIELLDQEDMTSFPLFSRTKYLPDCLIFLGFSHKSHTKALSESIEENICTFLTNETLKSFLVKILFNANLQLEFNSNPIEAIPSLIYGQAVLRSFQELEKAQWTKQFGADVFTGFEKLLPKLLEKILTKGNGNLEGRKGERDLEEISRTVLEKKRAHLEDPFWDCELPINCLIEAAQKLNFELTINEPPSDTDVSFKNMCRRLSDENMDETIQVLNAERKLNPNKFHFETLFRNIPSEAMPELISLIDCILKILNNFLAAPLERPTSPSLLAGVVLDDVEMRGETTEEAGNEGSNEEITMENVQIPMKVENPTKEFISIASCWISAWLKKTKILCWTKSQFLWILKLSECVSAIARLATCQKYPSFTSEYVEFHSAQLYLPLYYIFLGIAGKSTEEIEEDKGEGYRLGSAGEDGNSEHFWRLWCAQKVSTALCTMPKATLGFIEPLPREISKKFMGILEERSEIFFKIASHRVLRKMRAKASTGVESDDLPIIPIEINDFLLRTSGLILDTIQKYEDGFHFVENSEESEEFNELADDFKHLIEIGESGGRWPVSEEVLISYLLVWDAILSVQKDSNEIATFVKEGHLLPRLLSIIFFNLIPPDFNPKSYFDSDVPLDPNSIPSLLWLTCQVLQKVLRTLPYTVRWWWAGLTRQKDKVHVEKFIMKYLSSKLATEELGKVRWDEADNVTVLSHPGCSELCARYKIEETTVQLTISLPLNHPLGPVSVKISDKKLHARITQLLNSRSHSLAAGLKLWKENLDDMYKGVDECSICFFILHHVTKQKPKLTCKVCKHKFHSACLYKWFSTSNKSECPLCRNIF